MRDKETSVPFHCLDLCPWNTKRPIHGEYKSGLRTSLEVFDVCDRLRVWPVPGVKNRYYVLDGNQRLGQIREINECRLIAEHFGLTVDEFGRPDPKDVKKVRDDDANAATLRDLSNRAINLPVDVLLMDRLDEADAILFNATFNRNHAVPDEAKVVLSFERAIKNSTNSVRSALARRMLRPDVGLVNPLPPPPAPLTGPRPSPALEAPVHKPADEIEAKYGPPPASPERRTAPDLKHAVPLFLSLSPEGHAQITSTVLRLNTRLYREKKLLEALNELEASVRDGKRKSIDIDSITCEIALLTIGRHAKLEDTDGSAPA